MRRRRERGEEEEKALLIWLPARAFLKAVIHRASSGFYDPKS